MMATVIGVRRGMSFKNDAGETISGCKVFWSFDDENVEGQMAEGKFFNTRSAVFSLANGLRPGDVVEVGYGRGGRIETLAL